MRITINGETREFQDRLHLDALLARLEIEPRKIAIERNLEIVPKSRYSKTLISDGDRIEIVQFVGGG